MSTVTITEYIEENEDGDGAYQFDTTKKIRLAMVDLNRKLIASKHSKLPKLYTIINCITAETFEYDELITTEYLQSQFENVGHVLSVKADYINALIIDVDCLKCKQSSHNMNDSDVLSFNNIVDLYTTMIEKIKTILACKHQLNFAVYQRSDHCGFHMYVDVSVSIFLYYEILNRLQSLFTQYPVQVDLCVSSLPLPYSAKSDNKQYKCIYETKRFDVYPKKKNYYELNVVLEDSVKTSSILICEFKKNTRTKYVYMKEVSPVAVRDTKRKILKNIRDLLNDDYEFHCDYPHPFATIDVRKVNMTSEPVEMTVLERPIVVNEDDSKNVKFVKHTSLKFMKIICAQYYKLTKIDDKLCNYFRNFLEKFNCMFAYYTIIALITYVYEMYELELNDDDDDDEEDIIGEEMLETDDSEIIQGKIELDSGLMYIILNDVLKTVCSSNLILNHIVERMIYKFKPFLTHTVQDVVKHGELWLNAIMNEIRNLEKPPKEYTILNAEPEELEMEIIKVLNEKLFPCKNMIYFEKWGMHKHEELKISKEYINYITSKLRCGNREIVTQDFNLAVKEAKYLWNSGTEKNISFKKKEYFLNLNCCSYMFLTRDYGVFNSITGLYQNKFPLLFFTCRRNYGPVPMINKKIERHNINSLILKCKLVEVSRMHFENLKNNMHIIKLNVIIQGLLRIDNCMNLDKMIAQSAFSTVATTLVECSGDQSLIDSMYNFAKVFKYYQISAIDMFKVERAIHYMDSRKQSYSLSNLYIANSTDTDIIPTYEGPDSNEYFPSDPALWEDYVSRHWKEHETTKLLIALATTAIILNMYLPSNSNYNFFQWKFNVKRSKYKLHEIPVKIYYKIMEKILKVQSKFYKDFVLFLLYFTNFNALNMEEFLTCMGQIYDIRAPRRCILNFIGQTSSGKSTFARIMINGMGEAIGVSPQSSASSKKEGGGGSSAMTQSDMSAINKRMCETHYFITHEATSQTLKHDWLKCITGGDFQTIRPLGKLQLESFEYCMSTLALAGNNVIKVDHVDEALMRRIKPFVTMYGLSEETDNVLLMLSNREVPKSFEGIDETSTARYLFNMIYCLFANNLQRDLTAYVLQNKLSIDKLNLFLRHNSRLWRLLYKCGVIYDFKMQIKLQDLLKRIERHEDSLLPEYGFRSMEHVIDTLSTLQEYDGEKKIFKNFGIPEEVASIDKQSSLDISKLLAIEREAVITENHLRRNLMVYHNPKEDQKDLNFYIELIKGIDGVIYDAKYKLFKNLIIKPSADMIGDPETPEETAKRKRDEERMEKINKKMRKI